MNETPKSKTPAHPCEVQIIVRGSEASCKDEVLASLRRFQQWPDARIELIDGGPIKEGGPKKHQGVGEGDQNLPKTVTFTDEDFTAELNGHYLIHPAEESFLIELFHEMREGNFFLKYRQDWTDHELSVSEARTFIRWRLPSLRVDGQPYRLSYRVDPSDPETLEISITPTHA